jgi:hypothetical protein
MILVTNKLLLIPQRFRFGFFHRESAGYLSLLTLPLPAKYLTNRRGDTSYVASTTFSTTTVTMPAKAITLTAFTKRVQIFPTNSLTATDY